MSDICMAFLLKQRGRDVRSVNGKATSNTSWLCPRAAVQEGQRPAGGRDQDSVLWRETLLFVGTGSVGKQTCQAPGITSLFLPSLHPGARASWKDSSSSLPQWQLPLLRPLPKVASPPSEARDTVCPDTKQLGLPSGLKTPGHEQLRPPPARNPGIPL